MRPHHSGIILKALKMLISIKLSLVQGTKHLYTPERAAALISSLYKVAGIEVEKRANGSVYSRISQSTETFLASNVSGCKIK